jgi:hypothetical protein
MGETLAFFLFCFCSHLNSRVTSSVPCCRQGVTDGVALAYNLGNFLRRLALPGSVKHRPLTTLREKLIKIAAEVVTHARHVFSEMAEEAVPKTLVRGILARIRMLRMPETVPG